MKQDGRDYVWWRKERNSVTRETRWAVRERRRVITTVDFDKEDTYVPGGFGEIVGTYDTKEEAVERTAELTAELTVAMSWGPA